MLEKLAYIEREIMVALLGFYEPVKAKNNKYWQFHHRKIRWLKVPFVTERWDKEQAWWWKPQILAWYKDGLIK